MLGMKFIFQIFVFVLNSLQTVTVFESSLQVGKFTFSAEVTYLNTSFNIEQFNYSKRRCAAVCLRNIMCNAVEMCQVDSNKICRLSKGYKPNETGILPANVCQRYQLVDGCGEWLYRDRVNDKCICSVDYRCEGVPSGRLSCFILGGKHFGVRCQNSSEHYWTIIQRRVDGSVNFYRSWKDYKNGFGSLTSEFWLGNDLLHLLTSSGFTVMRIELEDHSGEKRYAEYSSVLVNDENDKYRLSISGYSGNATDGMSGENMNNVINRFNDGMKFTTYDNDNDMSADNSSANWRGGWWYRDGHYANLNGEYGNNVHGKGINWYFWHDWGYSLKFVQMMLRKPELLLP